jgi:hypothetical protein
LPLIFCEKLCVAEKKKEKEYIDHQELPHIFAFNIIIALYNRRFFYFFKGYSVQVTCEIII